MQDRTLDAAYEAYRRGEYTLCRVLLTMHKYNIDPDVPSNWDIVINAMTGR